MKTKIESFLENKSNIDILAKEIAVSFSKYSSTENIDYSFDIGKGTGKIKSKQPNTSFYFDTIEGTSLDILKKYLFDKDLANIEKESEEEKNLMMNVVSFLSKVGKKIDKNYKDTIEESLRKTILPNTSKKDFPLDEIEIISIDIADYSSIPESNKYFLRIGKLPDTSIDTEKIITYVNDQQEKTGKTVQDILEEEKEKNNRLFHNVIDIELGRKYLYDVNITLFANYSLSEMPPKEVPPISWKWKG